MQDAAPPARKRWFQFTLRDCLIASVAIAATIAPLKLYERFNPPARQVMLRAVVYRADAQKLREHVRGWNESQLRAVSEEEIDAIVDQLRKADINLDVVSAPTVMTIDGQEASFMVGSQIPIVADMEGQQTITMADTGIRFSAKPTILPNGRIHFDLALQQLSPAKAPHRPSETIPAAYITPDLDISEAAISVQRMNLPAELAPGETLFLVDAGDGLQEDSPQGEGMVIQVRVTGVK